MHISTPKPSKIMTALRRHETLASFCHGTRSVSVLDSIVTDPRIKLISINLNTVDGSQTSFFKFPYSDVSIFKHHYQGE